jgi:hypothetical protein
MNFKPLLVASLGLAISSNAALAGSAEAPVNPIFEHALVHKLSVPEDRAVVGKGSYADYYGYYGMWYTALASQYGSMGFYYKDYSSYLSAYYYADSAMIDFYNAYYYQYYGE